MDSKQNYRTELRAAIGHLSDRCLYSASKWCPLPPLPSSPTFFFLFCKIFGTTKILSFRQGGGATSRNRARPAVAEVRRRGRGRDVVALRPPAAQGERLRGGPVPADAGLLRGVGDSGYECVVCEDAGVRRGGGGRGLLPAGEVVLRLQRVPAGGACSEGSVGEESNFFALLCSLSGLLFVFLSYMFFCRLGV